LPQFFLYKFHAELGGLGTRDARTKITLLLQNLEGANSVKLRYALRGGTHHMAQNKKKRENLKFIKQFSPPPCAQEIT
jgi:hypothetical protein